MISYGKCAWVVTRHGLDLIQGNFDDRFLKKTRQPVFPQTEKKMTTHGNIWSPRDASDHVMAPFGGSIRVSGCPLAMTSQWSPRNLVMALFFGVPTTQLDAKLCQVLFKPAFCGGKYHFNQKTLNFYKFGQNWGAQKSSASKLYSISVMCFFWRICRCIRRQTSMIWSIWSPETLISLGFSAGGASQFQPE